MNKLILTTLLLMVTTSAYAGWFSKPEVESVNAVSSDTIQICFKEPFSTDRLIYSLDFETTLGKPFSQGGYYKQLLTKNSKDTCSSNIRLYDYFDLGNSTPKEFKKIMSRLELSSFEKITVKIATPKGQTSITKTQPDDVIFEQGFSFKDNY
ncbi:hypothetical protein ACOZZ1_000433 [Vibrio fluvialis]